MNNQPHKLSRYCPSCHACFGLDMTHCPHRSCRRLGSLDSEKKIAIKLWTVELLPNGCWRYHQPESLNPAAIKHLAREHKEAPNRESLLELADQPR
jgi:hypothetical protein